MHSSCDPAAEYELHVHSFGQNKIYPTQSYNSANYYEENQLYSEINEHHHGTRHKSIKKETGISPIEIKEDSTVNIDLPPITWHGYETPPKILNVINTGQTILINGQWTKCRPYIQGGPLNGSYIFSQIHFHSPSEHEIDGRRYPLEMHVVHYKTSYLTQERAMEEKDGTVVLVYLFQVENRHQTVLSSITDLAHQIEKENDRAELHDIILNQVLQPFASNYYLYWGSVSTTKNSYLLQWIISCANLYVTQEEVDSLTKILCSCGLNEKQTRKMSPMNDVVYRVGEEDYDVPLKTDLPKCECKKICRSCHTCAFHKGECQSHFYSHISESHCCDLKEGSRKNVRLQTSSFDKSLGICKKSSVNNVQKNKEKKKNTDCSEASVICICSSKSSNSQTSICECGKKKKKKKKVCKVQKILSCPSMLKTVDNVCHNDEVEVAEKSLSCLLITKSVCECEAIEKKSIDSEKKQIKSQEKNHQQVNEQDVVEKSSSKISIKSSKLKKNKSVSPKSEKSRKTGKIKKKAPESRSEDTAIKEAKKEKKKKKNKPEECDPAVDIQCMSAVEYIDKPVELLSNISYKCIKDKREEMTEPKESLSLCEVEKIVRPEEIIEGKSLITSGLSNEIKTLFTKKKTSKNQETALKDCTVNFLLSPNIVLSESSCTVLVTGSEVIKKSNTENENSIETTPSKDMNSDDISTTEPLSVSSKAQSKELCLQTEIFFRTENQGDFPACISQDYNVAILYNRNLLQEFKGTFSPKELELGNYEKLELVPKFPDSDNISVRLEDCIVKMESSNGLYIRAKFLLNKIDFSESATDVASEFCKDGAAHDTGSMMSVFSKKEKLQQDNECGKSGNSNESVLKNETLESQDFEFGVKKLDTNLEMDDKSITVDSLQQASTPMEKEEKDFIEKNENKLKNLFCKRKKTVYFICEKIEKDENSGKKIFVGNFRTREEIKALSKDRKLRMNPDSFFPIEKSLESKKEKKLFLLSNKESDFEKLIRIESAMKQEYKLQSTTQSKQSDKLDKSKDLIMLHSYKPRNSQANCVKSEGKNLEFQDQDISKTSNLLTPVEINNLKTNSKKSVISSSFNFEKSTEKNKSQITLIIIPVEGDDLSKIEVILIEHIENNDDKNKKSNEEKDNNQNKKGLEENNDDNSEKNNEKINDDNNEKGNEKKNNKKNKKDEEKEKEYIPCLNCYEG